MIREVHESDLRQIVVLLQQLHENSPAEDKVPIDETILLATIRRIRLLEHVKVIGFESDGIIVGMCTIGRIEDLSHNGRPFAVIENVIVEHAHRQKGIGKRLVKHALAIGENWDCYKVILETGTGLEWKLSFYEKCGLERGGKKTFFKRF
jgi:GNAT superfamily N-acetyltransferase